MEESREVTVDGQHHIDTPGEEGELAKDDVLGGPTENTIEDEVNQEGVEAGLGSIFSRYLGIQLATEVFVLNISIVVTLRGRNTEPIAKEVLYVNSNSELTSSSEIGVLSVSTGHPSFTSDGPSLGTSGLFKS